MARIRFTFSRNLRAPLVVMAITAVMLTGCRTISAPESGSAPLVDAQATRQTRALFDNLKLVSERGVMFGHQDDLAYGVNWKREKNRSDVKDVAGSYPAVFGWELGDLETGVDENLDNVNFADMQRWIKQGYKEGGVITIAWHMDNPESAGSAWDTTRAIHTILPGGANHDMFKSWLDRFADFNGGLKVGRLRRLGGGHYVPIIFRPYHEHTGSWFWWGGRNVTPEEYKALWRFTVEYLRDEKGLHNLLYAFSTDVFDTPEQYLRYYPGDDYVDMLGYDDYHSLRSDSTIATMTRRLGTLVEIAEARGKIAALTETGLEGVPDDDWWTNRLLRAITADEKSSRIAYALVWRNANSKDMRGHHYGPYAGHPSAPDFVRFYEDPFVLFCDGLPNMYR